jgi:hypothetical protein
VFDGADVVADRPKSAAISTNAGRHQGAKPMPDPVPEHLAAISDGVAQALQRMFGSNDADARFFDAVRQGTRDALWLIAANATNASERSAGHAD